MACIASDQSQASKRLPTIIQRSCSSDRAVTVCDFKSSSSWYSIFCDSKFQGPGSQDKHVSRKYFLTAFGYLSIIFTLPRDMHPLHRSAVVLRQGASAGVACRSAISDTWVREFQRSKLLPCVTDYKPLDKTRYLSFW